MVRGREKKRAIDRNLSILCLVAVITSWRVCFFAWPLLEPRQNIIDEKPLGDCHLLRHNIGIIRLCSGGESEQRPDELFGSHCIKYKKLSIRTA